jgi:hypothetical protein
MSFITSPKRRALGWSLFLFILAPGVRAQPCGTPGRDGSGTITGTVSSYYPGNGTVAAGATALPVGARSGATANIASGDLLLVIQMQDAAINSTDTSSYGDGTAGGGNGSTALNSSGLYEFVVATGPVSGGSVPILSGGNGGVLLNSYTNAAAAGARWAAPARGSATRLTAPWPPSSGTARKGRGSPARRAMSMTARRSPTPASRATRTAATPAVRRATRAVAARTARAATATTRVAAAATPGIRTTPLAESAGPPSPRRRPGRPSAAAAARDRATMPAPATVLPAAG